MKKVIFSFLVLSALLVSCGEDDKDPILDTTPPVVFDCNNRIISANATWEDVNTNPNAVDYQINCAIFVTNGAILTIKPGVRIQFTGATSGIVVQDDGGLVANGGQSGGQIYLEGKNHTKGEWSGVVIRANNPLTSFSNLTISDAGAGSIVTSLFGGGLEIGRAPVGSNVLTNVYNCTFENNKGNGFVVDYNVVIESFNNNTFNNNELAPIKIDAFNMSMLNDNNTFFGNGENYIDVYKGHATNGYLDDITVRKIALPYRIGSNQKLIMRDGDLTINPGVVLEMGSNSELNTYNSGTATGRIKALGTASEPIIIKGVEDVVGYWKGINIGTNQTNELTYVLLSNAGSAAVNTLDPDYITGIFVTKAAQGRASITNCTISKSGGYGLVYGTTSLVTQSGNSFSGNTLTDIFTF